MDSVVVIKDSRPSLARMLLLVTFPTPFNIQLSDGKSDSDEIQRALSMALPARVDVGSPVSAARRIRLC